MVDEEKSPNRKVRWLFFVALVGLLVIGVVLGKLVTSGIMALVPVWSQGDLETDINTYIYDGTGQQVAVLYGEKNRLPVELNQISPLLVRAFLDTEDRRFYEHSGVDLRAIARAVTVNARAGSAVEGGSTITQQLVKNSLLSSEKTLHRKIAEALLALDLERKLSKDEILQLYLNRIYFGHGAYGVESAARIYFGKSAQNLSLAEATMLAGIPKNPRKYSPYYNPNEARVRQNVVLDKMVEAGDITVAQATEARGQELPYQGLTPSTYQFPYFIDAVLDEAVDQRGIREDQLYRGGLHIYTTLDPKIQAGAQRVLANQKNFPRSPADQQVQSGVAVVDYRTGYVKALVGGRNYEARRGFNRATQLLRQPGSTFKPIAVYGPALEKKYPPTTVLEDAPVSFGNYTPKNSGGGFGGWMQMKDALRHSVNVYAVKLLDLIGVESGVQFARKLGFKLEKEDQGLALALGGLSKGVAPLDMARGFGAFANQGVLVPPATIIKITDHEGKVLYENKSAGRRVMTQQTASLMTDMLRGVVNSGTGTRARLGRRPVAGKTGTTQLPDTREFNGLGGNKDAWFVGYTPELVAAVWLGYDHTDRKHYLRGIYGGTYPAQIWREVMKEALQELPVHQFPKYQGKLQYRKGVRTSVHVYRVDPQGYLPALDAPGQQPPDPGAGSQGIPAAGAQNIDPILNQDQGVNGKPGEDPSTIKNGQQGTGLDEGEPQQGELRGDPAGSEGEVGGREFQNNIAPK